MSFSFLFFIGLITVIISCGTVYVCLNDLNKSKVFLLSSVAAIGVLLCLYSLMGIYFENERQEEIEDITESIKVKYKETFECVGEEIWSYIGMFCNKGYSSSRWNNLPDYSEISPEEICKDAEILYKNPLDPRDTSDATYGVATPEIICTKQIKVRELVQSE